MADKWAIRSNNEGLNNRGKTSRRRGSKNRKKEQEGRITVAYGRTQLKEKYFI